MEIDAMTVSRWEVRRKRIAYLSLRGAQFLGSKLLGREKKVSSLMVYPPVNDQHQLGDILNRLSWALTGNLLNEVSITVPCNDAKEMSDGNWITLPVPDSHYNYLEGGKIGDHCIWLDTNRADAALKKADLVLFWDISALRQLKVMVHLPRLVVVDPTYYLAFEAINYAHLQHRLAGKEIQTIERQSSLQAFQRLYKRFEGVRSAYLFVTGPSLEQGLNRPVPKDSLRIICNSIVKNDTLLAKIQPDVLTFADPVFHFGVSRYAAEFRRCVEKVLNRYKECFCLVPETFASLLRSYYPHFSDRIIGMPLKKTGGLNFPTPDNFYVRMTHNILTMLMLPLGTSLAQKTYILGADGRKKNETYYWQHNPSVQFGDLMQTVFDAHPSFVSGRVFEDYYEEHCRLLNKMIGLGEDMKGRKYIAKTPSYIPALSARYNIEDETHV